MPEATPEVVEQPVVPQVPAEQSAKDAEADFSKGYVKVHGDKTPSPDAKPETKTETKVEAKAETKEAAAPDTKEVPAAEVKADETPKPVLIAGMTEQEWNAKVAKGAGTEELRAEIRKNFGQIGEVNRIVKDLAKKLSAGTTGRKISAEALKRVNEELPGLGDALAQDLSEILGGSDAAQVAADTKGKPFDADAWHKEKLAPALEAMEARIAKVGEDAQMELLLYMHADFDTVVTTPEFKTWLDTLPAERRESVRTSQRAVVAGQAVTEFKEWKAKAEKKAAANKNRLENAITPQGVGAAPSKPTQDDEADFTAGYKKQAAKKKA